MYNIYTRDGAHVAIINKVGRLADPQGPYWALLLNNGKTRKFDTFAEAKDEAQKAWPWCKVKRSAS